MDFITYLPPVGNYDSVLDMVNRFIKMAHFAPYAKAISGAETTYLFYFGMSFVSMDSQLISLRIVGHSSFLISGNDYFKRLVALSICLPLTMHKPMDNQRIQPNS